jgi:hypothetical protein
LSKEIAFNPPDRIVKRTMMMISPTATASGGASASNGNGVGVGGVISTDFQRQVNRFNNRSDGDVMLISMPLSRLTMSKKLATQT